MTKSPARQHKFPLMLSAIAASIGTLVLGASLLYLSQEQRWFTSEESQPVSNRSNAISALIPLAPQQRAAQLEQLARQGNAVEQKQARYLLATDLLQQKQGKAALAWLDGLEKRYPVLAAEILLHRAQAYTQAGQPQQAQTTWQSILERYPEQPEAAEALYALGATQPQYWDRAIAEFPAHPVTAEIAQRRLQKKPAQPQLLLLLAKHALYLPEITNVLDRLTTQYKDQLEAEDWQAIAFGYWEKQEYAKAGAAYARAPHTPLNLYRAGRGLQLGDKPELAQQAYQQLIAEFPKSEETATALVKLADVVAQPQQALPYLDLAVQLNTALQQPNAAGEALLIKARILDQLNQPQVANQVRQQLLTTYAQSDAAADWRWRQAQKKAATKDFAAAKSLAWEIVQQNPQSEQAPKAAFWSAKWASQLGLKAEADRAYQQVWTRYPQSYYAWRTASLAGWAVGDFTSVRYLSPEVAQPQQRLALPTGSATLKELYQLGQNRDAWEHWQWEFQNRVEPTLSEQLTDGLIRLGVGDYLDGIYMLSNLRERSRNEPKAGQFYQKLQQQPGYWQALYPLPYINTVVQWSQARNLNPLLVMALIRQESRFQPQIRSVAGAVGLMQVMPETGQWIAKQINLKHYKLDQPNDNVNLGTWYLDHTHETYNDNSMLAIASYNAGPGSVSSWIKNNKITDEDAFVEAIPYPETRNYVEAVLENHWNYLRLYNPGMNQIQS